MQRIVTLTERKATETARRRDAVAALIPVLTDYARTHGGRYLLSGSAARRTMIYHSDVDLPPYRGCKLRFLDHIAADTEVLG